MPRTVDEVFAVARVFDNRTASCIDLIAANYASGIQSLLDEADRAVTRFGDDFKYLLH